jgi:putative transposase
MFKGRTTEEFKQDKVVVMWAYHHGTRIDFSDPGRQTDNAFIDSLNGWFRDECLNIHWLETLKEAQRLIEAWRIDYNESSLQMTFGNKTPAECLLRAIPSPSTLGKKVAEN